MAGGGFDVYQNPDRWLKEPRNNLFSFFTCVKNEIILLYCDDINQFGETDLTFTSEPWNNHFNDVMSDEHGP